MMEYNAGKKVVFQIKSTQYCFWFFLWGRMIACGQILSPYLDPL